MIAYKSELGQEGSC